MATLRVSDDLEMYYQLNDFTDPWGKSEAVMLMHGNSESGDAWFGWIPYFGREYRLIRPDMRGFGKSTPMAADYEWRLERLAQDYETLLEHLGEKSVHVIAAKIGCVVALHFAATHPERVKSVTVLAPPASGGNVQSSAPAAKLVEEGGVEKWARANMGSRLGKWMPPEAHDYWATYMGRTASSTQIGFIRSLHHLDANPVLEKIQAPTLVVATNAPGPAGVEAAVKWQPRIANSDLMVVPNTTIHPALTDTDTCATAALAFIRRNSGK